MSERKLLCAVALMLLGINSIAAADVCTYWPGYVTCGKGIVQDVNGLGFVKINGTTISNSLNVTGQTDENNADINQTRIIGNVKISNSISRGYFDVTGNISLDVVKFLGQVKLIGLLTASESEFDNSINIISEISTFRHSTLKDLTISRSEHVNEKVYLQNHSVVNGNITFESGNGLVIESDGSEVIGQVIGGKIIKE